MGPKQLLHYQSLVEDAVSNGTIFVDVVGTHNQAYTSRWSISYPKGAKVLAGGYIPDKRKSFYPPTVKISALYRQFIQTDISNQHTS